MGRESREWGDTSTATNGGYPQEKVWRVKGDKTEASSASGDAAEEKDSSTVGSRERVRDDKDIYHPPPSKRNPLWTKEEWQEWMETSNTHFQKCHNVAMEIFMEFPEILIDLLQAMFSAPTPNDKSIPRHLGRPGARFLDLGCAPGGFSQYLLEYLEYPHTCEYGIGVTLPQSEGGFPLLVQDPGFWAENGAWSWAQRFFPQWMDLFKADPSLFRPWGPFHLCTCDAQDLSIVLEPWRKPNKLRIWALLLQELRIGLQSLCTTGILIFRFSWVLSCLDDCLAKNHIWYYTATMKLFALLHNIFEDVQVFKSELTHKVDSTCYVLCRRLRPPPWKPKDEEGTQVPQPDELWELFRESVSEVKAMRDEEMLPSCSLFSVLECTPSREEEIVQKLEKVTRLREIGRSEKGLPTKRWKHVDKEKDKRR